MLTIQEQPNYQDFTQDQPPIHLTAQEFFELSKPSIYDFADVTNPNEYKTDQKLYDKINQYFTNQSAGLKSFKTTPHILTLIYTASVNNMPITAKISKQNHQVIDFLMNQRKPHKIYLTNEIKLLDDFINTYKLTNKQREYLVKHHALDQYAQVTKLIHHATEHELNLKLS